MDSSVGISFVVDIISKVVIYRSFSDGWSHANAQSFVKNKREQSLSAQPWDEPMTSIVGNSKGHLEVRVGTRC